MPQPNTIKSTLLLIFTICVSIASPAQDTVLTQYINTGLENNIALQRKYDSLEISLLALRASRGLFYPDLSFNARYSVAEGGRMIDFPVGDLLNPVYQTLNELTQRQQFPAVTNMQFPVSRPTEQETKLSLCSRW